MVDGARALYLGNRCAVISQMPREKTSPRTIHIVSLKDPQDGATVFRNKAAVWLLQIGGTGSAASVTLCRAPDQQGDKRRKATQEEERF